MGLVDGARAIVTGGASGIGAATCRRLVEEGASVAVLDRDGPGAEQVAADIGAIARTVDVTDEAALTDAVRSAADELGGLSIMFNNAGIGMLQPLHEWPADLWHQIVSVSLDGVFYGMKASIPLLLEGGGGSIVNTASISGTRPAAGEAPYSAAKAGIAAVTASAALEYGPAIRVNAVAPGMIRTALTGPLLMGLPDLEERYAEATPAARMGEPDDVADVVVFLCSDLARFITGQNIVVDGGMTLHGSGIDGVLRAVQDRFAGG